MTAAGSPSPPDDPRRTPPRWAEPVVRGAGALLALGAGIPWLMLVREVLASRLGDPSQDPHGYVLVFGTMLAVPAGLLAATGAGLAAPRRLRARVLLIALAVAVVLAVALVALLATAPPWTPPGAAP